MSNIVPADADGLDRFVVKGRRDLVLTENVFKTIADLAAKGHTEGRIAKALGMCWVTWERLADQCSDVRVALRYGRLRDADEVICAMRKNAMKGNVTAQIAYLKLVHGYRDSGPVEGDAPVRVNITLPGAMTPEQYAGMSIEVAAGPERKP